MGASRAVFPIGLPVLAIIAGAATPVASTAGALSWSSTLSCVMFWDGAAWRILPQSRAPVSVGAATYTVLATDTDIIFSVACTVTLPAAANFIGREIVMKNIAAVAVISNASNVKPLATNVAGTALLAATAGKWVRIVSDGTNWIVMSGA
jgi:hypothetical protein